MEPRMRSTLSLLKLLTKSFPPPDRQHHSLTLTETGTLLLSLWVDSHALTFHLDDLDLEKSPETLLCEIRTLLVSSSSVPVTIRDSAKNALSIPTLGVPILDGIQEKAGS